MFQIHVRSYFFRIFFGGFLLPFMRSQFAILYEELIIKCRESRHKFNLKLYLSILSVSLLIGQIVDQKFMKIKTIIYNLRENGVCGSTKKIISESILFHQEIKNPVSE